MKLAAPETRPHNAAALPNPHACVAFTLRPSELV